MLCVIIFSLIEQPHSGILDPVIRNTKNRNVLENRIDKLLGLGTKKIKTYIRSVVLVLHQKISGCYSRASTGATQLFVQKEVFVKGDLVTKFENKQA